MAASCLRAQTVTDIRPEGALLHHPVDAALTLHKGDALDESEIRRTMQNLYRTGYFSQVEILREPDGDGVRLIIRMVPYPIIRKVRITGTIRPTHAVVLPGTPCTQAFEESFAGDLKSKLKAEGYLHPAVTLSLQKDILWARIEAGARSRIADVRVDADGPDAPPAPLRALKGGPFREERVRLRIESLQKKLRKAYPEVMLRYDGFEEIGADVILKITAQGLRPVAYAWSPAIGRGVLRGFRKEFQAEGLRQETLYRLAGTLEEQYHNSGYPQARAHFTLDRGADKDTVRGEFFAGPRFALGEIRVEGADPREEKTLLSLLGAQRTKWLSADRLAQWRDLIQARLAESGYVDAQAAARVDYDGGRGTARVTYAVKPGIQYAPEVVDITGLPSGVPRPALAVERGKPLALSKVKQDLQHIEAYLNGLGYDHAQVTLRKEEKKLVYEVRAGEKTTIVRHFFRNLFYTRGDALDAEVRIKDGEPLSFARLLDTQSKLYLTGLFASVDVSPVQDWDHPGEAVVVTEVREDSPRSYAYGIGYDTYDRLRVQLGISHANLAGTRRYLGLDALVSDKEQQWRLTYREPHLLGIPYPLQVTTYRSDEQQPDFSLKRWGTTMEFIRNFGRQSRASLSYTYEIQEPFNVSAGYPVPREESEEKVSSFGAAYIRDGRDDVLFPSRGIFFSADVRFAFPFFSATSRFLKSDLSWGLYASPAHDTILAGSVRIGAIHNMADEPIPLGERFFLGGRDTVRAYSRDMLGVEGGTIIAGQAIGGNLFLLANAELRQKVSDLFGVTVFTDAGQVWPDSTSVHLGDLAAGSGVGIFFLSPIGPVRLEYARKWKPVSWDDLSQWYLSLGFPF